MRRLINIFKTAKDMLFKRKKNVEKATPVEALIKKKEERKELSRREALLEYHKKNKTARGGLTKKQMKGRKREKMAKKSRQINYKKARLK